MTKLTALLAFLFLLGTQVVSAQVRDITGTVTSAQDGSPLPGVNVVVKGTTNGTVTDLDGKYKISVSQGQQTLVFSFIGMQNKEVITASSSVIDVQLSSEDNLLSDVVVTALGVSREKKALGYATQKVSGEDINTVKSDNFVNGLSGKVSGVQIRTNNNFGGSTNVVVRGITSMTGGNQALFVIDGVPVDNSVSNTARQKSGSTGYDYGNKASDINPEDIESINVLKGAAATALYGSRASNGVILITTKSGKKKQGIGVSVSSSVTFGNIDKSTFISYQDQYGAGYGPYYGETGYFEDVDVNNDGTSDLVVPTYDDASYGAKFAGQMVYQWDSFVGESPNFGKKTEYKAGAYTPVDFFETEVGYNNSVVLDGGNDKGTFRLGYTNFINKGILPNSEIKKHNLSFKSSYNFSEKFKADFNMNYTYQAALGRNSTGYSDNLMSSFRQWYQVNVDMNQQKEMYELTGRNVTWNMAAPWAGDFSPLYWDNPYWTRYKNYQTDSRNRLFGYFTLSYDVTSWLKASTKVSLDTYSELQEERRAVGSVAAPFGLLGSDEQSGYQRYNRDFMEQNYDGFLSVNKPITDDISFSALTGFNIRRTSANSVRTSTNGGLFVPGLYAITNSAQTVPAPVEYEGVKQVNGVYFNASLGYKNFLYFEPTFRRDQSSALPEANQSYNYFSVSSSLIFSEFLQKEWLSLGKFRINYAEVGNDLAELNVIDTYVKPDIFGGSTLFSVGSTKNNADLKPERTKSIEAGIELSLFNNRLGFDMAVYKMNTLDQLIQSEVSPATGYSSKWVNAGNVENRGMELSITGKPLVMGNFVWEARLNWSMNRNEVIELYKNPATGEPLTNIVLQSFQGGVTINATLNEPYGVIRGTGYKLHNTTGERMVTSSGYYMAEADKIIADPNPDWLAGLTNTFSYKGLVLSFLIDMQQGGDVYSLDMHYGQATGLTDNTVGTNDRGGLIRDPLSKNGGVLNPGVYADGKPNTTYAPATNYGQAFYWGNAARNPSEMTVYDASYVKLREVSLSYRLPKQLTGSYLQNVSVGFTGRNLLILHKNVPYADPESGLGAGNVQGYLSGSYPTVRQYGFNVKIDF